MSVEAPRLMAGPIFNWAELSQTTKSLYGQDAVAILDLHQVPRNSLLAPLATLLAIDTPQEKVIQELRKCPHKVMKHVFLSFMGVLSVQTWIEIQTLSNLDVTANTTPSLGQYLILASGNLVTWREAIINGCTDAVSIAVRHFFNACLLQLEQAKLKVIWSDFIKSTRPDGTFILERI